MYDSHELLLNNEVALVLDNVTMACDALFENKMALSFLLAAVRINFIKKSVVDYGHRIAILKAPFKCAI